MFHVKETLLVLKELLSVHPVFREQLLMATTLSVVCKVSEFFLEFPFHDTSTN